MKPKMLYLMHVPWGWIKQRPHFFAEKLSEDLEIDLYSIDSLIPNKKTQGNKEKKLRFNKKSIHLNGQSKKGIVGNIFFNAIYNLIFFFTIPDLKKYKYIWISDALFFKYIKKRINPDQILIFDCMDDNIEFPFYKKNNKLKNLYLKIEKETIKRANYIFFSSHYLAKKVIQRSGNPKKYIILNNAVELDINFHNSDSKKYDIISEKIEKDKVNFKSVLYLGTISEWLDFELIIQTFSKLENIKLYLVGPTDYKIPDKEFIEYLGIIDRSHIFNLMSKVDALIMPFKVTELIKSVNPVKLYEYIASGKPSIAPLYSETEKFTEYIYTYQNQKDFEKIINLLIHNKLLPKKNNEECLSFLKENTWDHRKDEILNLIK